MSKKQKEWVSRATAKLHANKAEIEARWKLEVDRRIGEIQGGKVPGMPLNESLARIRKIAGL